MKLRCTKIRNKRGRILDVLKPKKERNKLRCTKTRNKGKRSLDVLKQETREEEA